LAVLSVRQALAAVAELQEAGLQLVCWQLSVREHEARPASSGRSPTTCSRVAASTRSTVR
jgi:hypothetical protein